jgi:chromosome condensin MukBEF MukE localization factor
MNPTHFTRQELYEELAEAKKEAEHYKIMTEEATKAFAELLNDIHAFLRKTKND